MFGFLGQIFLRRQDPKRLPPAGWYGLRVSQSGGSLVLVDSAGTETAVTPVTSVAGRTGAVTIASADITDATADGFTNKGKVLKTDASGNLQVTAVTTEGNVAVKGLGGLLLYEDTDTYPWALSGSNVTAERAVQVPDVDGILSVVTSYADESAANTAEAANVVYYNVATGKFQITTA